MKGVVLTCKIKAEHKALILCPALFVLVGYELVCEMRKIRSLAYYLRAQDNCMTLGEVAG